MVILLGLFFFVAPFSFGTVDFFFGDTFFCAGVIAFFFVGDDDAAAASSFFFSVATAFCINESSNGERTVNVISTQLISSSSLWELH